MKEQAKGWWTPWRRMESIKGEFASHLYFGKDEGDKIRGILAPDNNVATLPEKLVPLGIDGWVSLIRWAYEDPQVQQAQLFKEDWKSGFRQLQLHPEHRRYFVASSSANRSSVITHTLCTPSLLFIQSLNSVRVRTQLILSILVFTQLQKNTT